MRPVKWPDRSFWHRLIFVVVVVAVIAWAWASFSEFHFTCLLISAIHPAFGCRFWCVRARWNVVWHAIQIDKRDLNLSEVSVCCVFFFLLVSSTHRFGSAPLCCGCITSQFGMRRIQSIMMTMWELFKCTIQPSASHQSFVWRNPMCKWNE